MYSSQVEPDLIGIDPTRPVVHTSLYESLRTNLSREVMGFMDYPFVPRGDENRDPRRFPGHREVLVYLQDFARDFGIEEMVRFECEVVSVEMVDNGDWKVKSRGKRLDNHDNGFLDEIFDAVVVCNGHFTEPRIAEIPGIYMCYCCLFQNSTGILIVSLIFYFIFFLTSFSGINLWPGKQIHSHNYRNPEPFRDQACLIFLLLYLN